MDSPPFLKLIDDHAVLRPKGTLMLAEVVDLITHAIEFVREAGIRRLLVVLTEVTGFISPGRTARYEFIREWARVSGGLVRVAIATQVEILDGERFGVTVATNAGMVANVFTDEKAALEWLLGEGERQRCASAK